MALKVPRELQKKWEAKLKAEGLAPLTTYGDGERVQRRLKQRLLSLTAKQRGATDAYYARANKFLHRIELAHTVWQLHCQGMGRRGIASFAGVPEKVVRLVLKRLHGISGLTPPSFGGED